MGLGTLNFVYMPLITLEAKAVAIFVCYITAFFLCVCIKYRTLIWSVCPL